ncbi:MAG: NAD(P)/FAD-dependent oxidoreductase [Verrucomicrobia bacterium]|nr:MAG: NAD(P)/FAD-dependent oxidoreductase [Verrucomicrobiota bacterium]
MTDTFDFLVIGGGSAGYAAASTAAGLGLRVAVVEGGTEVGGLCILRGCMPSKALLESAHRAEAIRHAGEFGLRAEFLGADAGAIRARKRRLIGEFADYRRGQLESGRFEFVRGRAAFADPHTLEVRLPDGGLRRLTARACLVATGSAVQRIDLPGLREVGAWTSDDVLDADIIPASVVILGGGAIALELASYYCGIGSKVTVIQRGPQLLTGSDPDIADALADALEHRGIVIHRGTTLLRAETAGSLKRIVFRQGDADLTADGERIICALGRHPHLDGLAPEKAGLTVERGRLRAAATQQCGAPHLFAAGDVCGPHEIVHIAIQQGEIAARNAARVLGKLDGPLEEIDYRLKLLAIFTHPQVATAGLSERECAAQNIPVLTAKYLFADHGKTLIRAEPDGFVKLIVERDSRRILGAACVGPEASELIHEIVVAMHFRATAADLARIPHYHPTLSEIWTYPAEELA